jgi:hypothetical protein
MNLIKRLTFLFIAAITLALPFEAYATNDTTVEGQSTHFSTGESYANNVILTGYNSRDKKLYLNYDLVTTRTVAAGEVATFNYNIKVFNNLSSEIGSYASDAGSPESTTAGANTLGVTNREITLSAALPDSFRVIITVNSVSVATP